MESPEYELTRLRLMADPVVQAMAIGCKGQRRSLMAHDDGTPRHEFMLAALREYEQRAGQPAGSHIGGVAEAILRLLDTPEGEWPVTRASEREARRQAAADQPDNSTPPEMTP